jgi:hypothetical protein
VRAACLDSAESEYPLIVSCPFRGALGSGGPGRLVQDRAERRSLRLSARERFRAAGEHDVQVGVEADLDETESSQVLSGGRSLQMVDGNLTSTTTVVVVASAADDASGLPPCPGFGGIADFRCRDIGSVVGAPGTTVDTTTRNLAVYARDAWRPHRDVTIEAGVRVEAQQVLYPGDLRGGVHPVTSLGLGSAAFSTHRIAPRGALTYDFTGEGRGAVFVRAARLVEPVRTEVVERVLSRIATMQVFGTQPLISLAFMTIDPAIEAGYTDEVVAGVQAEPARGLYVGAWLHHRAVGTTVEDVLADDEQAFVLANPGQGEAAHVQRPERTYDALTLTASRRFARLYVLASYVHARARGSYTGAVDYDERNIASNLSRQFDEPHIGANRGGVLPQDIPHMAKLDASYTRRLGAANELLLGVRARLLSGPPIAALDVSGDSMLLPRGAFGRLDVAYDVDLRVGYRRALKRNMALELYVDAINAADLQSVTAVEDTYTLDRTQALSPGADQGDLLWLKDDVGKPASRNPSFGRPVERFAPRALRLGARLVF